MPSDRRGKIVAELTADVAPPTVDVPAKR